MNEQHIKVTNLAIIIENSNHLWTSKTQDEDIHVTRVLFPLELEWKVNIIHVTVVFTNFDIPTIYNKNRRLNIYLILRMMRRSIYSLVIVRDWQLHSELLAPLLKVPFGF